MTIPVPPPPPQRQTIGYLLIHGAAGLFALGTYFAFSRTVTPADYGGYALVVATASAVNAFLYSWIGISLNRFFQDPSVDQEQYLSSVLVLFGVLSAAVVAGQVAILSLWTGPVPLIVAVTCPLITILTAWFGVALQLARARLQVATYGVKTLMHASLLMGLGTLFAVWGWGMAGLLLALVAALVSASVSTLAIDLRGVSLRSASTVPLRRLAAYGWPLALCLGLSWVVGLSDRYLIYWLVGEEAAGQYALAYGFAQQPIWLALLASSRATLPLAARAYERGGDAAARAVLSQSLSMLLFLCLPVVALEIIAAPQLTGLLLGQAYSEAGAAIMPIVAVAAFLQGLRAFHLDISVHLSKRTTVLIGLWALAAGANVLFNLILIPAFGMVGAAWSTVIAHLVATVYFLVRVPRPDVLGLDRRDALKIGGGLLALLAVLGLLATFLDGVSFLLGAGVAGIAYCVLGWIVNPRDLRASLNLRRRAMQPAPAER